jgi:hypothetical protein
VLDVVAANTEPGALRDALHGRFLNSMLQKVYAVVRWGGEDRLDSFVTEVSAVIDDYFAPQVAATAPVVRRQLAAAILAGKRRKIRAAVRSYDRVAVRLNKFAVRPSEADGWTVSATATLALENGSPVLFRPHGDRWQVDKRLRVRRLNLPSYTAEQLLAGAGGELVLRSPTTGVVWLAVRSLTAKLEPSKAVRGAYVIRVKGNVELAPEHFAAGRPLPEGSWQLSLRVNALGTSRTVAIRREARVRVPRRARQVRGGAKLRFRRGGRLVLAVKGGEQPALRPVPAD